MRAALPLEVDAAALAGLRGRRGPWAVANRALEAGRNLPAAADPGRLRELSGEETLVVPRRHGQRRRAGGIDRRARRYDPGMARHRAAGRSRRY